MKNKIIIGALLLVSTLVSAQSKKQLIAEVQQLKEQQAKLKAEKDSIAELVINRDLRNAKDTFSYAFGNEVYLNNFAQQGLDKEVDLEAFYLGMRNASQGTLVMDAGQRSAIIQTKFAEIQKAQKEEQERLSAAKIQEGKDFLAENKTKEGVTELASGLQYKVLIPSKGGVSPSATDKVKVNYEGRLINGTIFDSSYQRGEPASFGVNGVIKGWTEILQLMKPGDKWEVYIPYNLAYGERGAGPNIKPYETLIFTVELIEVVGK